MTWGRAACRQSGETGYQMSGEIVNTPVKNEKHGMEFKMGQ